MSNIKGQMPVDPRQVVRGADEKGDLVFGQVGVEELSYRGRFGAVASSSTENTVAIGEHPFVIDDVDNRFRIGDDVLCTCLDDPTSCFMWGEIVAKGGTSPTAELTVYVDDLSDAVRTSSNWELQVVARPKFGITKDTSTSSVDPTAAGPFTITVTAGKFFPVGGKLLMIPLAARQIALVGEVQAYSGASLVVRKNSTNATVSTSYTSWAIALLDAPQYATQASSVEGLRVRTNSVVAAPDVINDFQVTPGRIRDYTDTVDLVLSSTLIKKLDLLWTAGDTGGAAVKSGNLAGTASSVGTAVTGLGTSFRDDFGGSGLPLAAGFLQDYGIQAGLVPALDALRSQRSIISSGAVTTSVTGTSSVTGLTTATNLGAAGATYQRGGAASGSAALTYAVGICRKDSDGSVDVFACSFKGLLTSTTHDLPSGYTYSRILASVTWDGINPLVIVQPLYQYKANYAEEIRFRNGSATGLSATDVEAAIVELATEKLDATSYTAADVLTKIKTVDGTGSGLDADTLDGHDTAFFTAAATTASAGIVELATDSETITGTDTTRAITPSNLASVTASTARAGIVELATNGETTTGTDAGRAVTPAGLAAAYTAADVLTKVKTVDGTGSGLDADLLDGLDSAAFTAAVPTTVDNTVPRFNGVAGSLQTSGVVIGDSDEMTVAGLRSQTFTLATDSAASFAPPGGLTLMVSYMCSGTPSATVPSGIIIATVSAATAPVSMAVTDATNVTYTATSLTGTTGGAATVGKLSFGSNGSGSLFIQNRLGGSRTIRLTVLTF